MPKDHSIHIKMTKDLKERMKQVGGNYGLNPSTFGRILIERHIMEYTKNRLFS